MDLLQGYTGLDLFNLDRHELERLLGRDEGRHLDSLLTVQKSNAGVCSHISYRFVLHYCLLIVSEGLYPDDI